LERQGPEISVQWEEPNLQPKGSPLSNSRQLGWLKMRESKSGKIFILFCEFCKAIDNYGQFREDNVATSTEKDEVCVANGNKVNISVEV
jgi:hypothetical protein